MAEPRRSALSGRPAVLVAVVTLASGALALGAGAQPTGEGSIDALYTAAVAMVVTWAAAFAPWWVLAAAAAIAAVGAGDEALTAVALAGALVGFGLGASRRDVAWLGALVGAVVVQVLLRMEIHGFTGLSAIFGVVASGGVLTAAAVGGGRRLRRGLAFGVVGAGVVAVGALLGLGASTMSASDPLREGNTAAHAALDALEDGNMPLAAASFATAADAFRRAGDDFSSVATLPSRLVPVAAQHRSSGARLAGSAADALDAAAGAVGRINPDSIRVNGGRIDVAAIRALADPFTDLRDAIDGLATAIDDVDSPWLVAPLQERLRSLRDDVADGQRLADNAMRAVELAPDMLGAGGVRRYFVAFTTPAEARGLGGFMGNWAEITITDGQIEMSAFGRTKDLDDGGADPAHRRVDIEDPDVSRRWGRFGLVDSDGDAAHLVWDNITMPPDFPTVADHIAQLYPQSGGQPIDGVFLLDPKGIAALMTFTGPVTVPGVPVPLTSDNVVPFIIANQYLVESTDDRVDLLDAIARATVEQLLTVTLPAPADLARTFAPLADEDRFLVWSSHPAEEAFLTEVGVDGAFPRLDGGDGIAVTFDNAGANKIDPFLTVSVDYRVERSEAVTSTRTTATIELTNASPASGLPEYVIGNVVGLPMGTNRTFLSVYSALPMTSATLDGVPVALESDDVFGWHVASQFLDIAPGQRRVLVVTFEGPLGVDAYRLTTWTPPRVLPIEIAVDGP